MTRLRVPSRAFPAIDNVAFLLSRSRNNYESFAISRYRQSVSSNSCARPFSTTHHRYMPNDLLIASLGNPSPEYDRTRHSAGHAVVRALARYLGDGTLVKEGREWARGKVARCQHGDTRVVLWQAPGYMNECGPAVLSAWRAFCTREVTPGSRPHLVVVHDEIEEVLGKFKIRRGSGYGARGHNGLRSILKIADLAKLDTTRVAVGVGPRPQSRESDVVAEFVLQKMSGPEIEKLEGLAGDIWRLLESRVGNDGKA